MSRKQLLLFILILIISSVCFFFIGRFTGLSSDAGTVLSNEDYAEFKDLKSEQLKMDEVESVIRDTYLYDFSEEDLNNGKLKGMVQALGDPYTEYYTKDEYEALMEDTTGEFGGIGIVVSPDDKGRIAIISPIADTPAQRAGIKSGDFIVSIDDVDFTAEQMNEAVELMRGEPGTSVKITVLRDGELLDFDLVREIIKSESVDAQMIPDYDLGYIRISSFKQNTYNEFVDKLDEMKKQGAKGIVLDLRGNPGGLLDSAENIADELLGKATIIYIQNKAGERAYAKSDAKMDDIPLVVLIDEGSASASEILAGTLKDNNRAKLVGKKSFGKGVVQRLHEFKDGTGLKITESEYYLPNGENIHKKGIEPDYEVELPRDIKGAGPEYLEEDTQLKKAVEVLEKQIK